jgi:hypothetical protein
MQARDLRCGAIGVLALLLIQTACDREGRASSAAELRDSAGVLMLDALTEGRQIPTWAVGEPDVLIGEAHAGEPLYRVTSGRFFTDGSFVIANEGSHELLFYSREGELERTAGREGAGPDEFRALDFVEIVADSVWVYDRLNQRLSVLGRSGDVARLIPLGAGSTQGLARAVGVFGDGSILLTRAEPRTIAPGLARTYRSAFVLHPDGSITDLGRFFRGESYWADVADGIADVGLPFAREGLMAVRGTEWFYSGGAEYRVGQYDMNGRPSAIFAYRAQPRSVTRGDLDGYMKELRDEAGGLSQREQLLRKAPLPERMPAYAGLLIDQEGSVWAAPYGEAGPQRCWHVYQRRPPAFARACLPDRLTPLDVAGNLVLGVLRDENDVERVARSRLVK